MCYVSFIILDTKIYRYIQTEALISDNNRDVREEFEKLLLVCHYYAVRCACRNVSSLTHVVVKISIALLRYSDIIPPDKAYYEAGSDARVNIYFLIYLVERNENSEV